MFEAVAMSGRLNELLTLLRCPACGGELAVADEAVACGNCAASYPLLQGVPQLAATLETSSAGRGALVRALHTIAARPSVYDRIQAVVGARELRARVAQRLSDANGKAVLDIGAGTGTLAGELPPNTTYLWLDSDPQKLRGLLARHTDVLAVIADATRIPLRDRAVDFAVCVNVSHHLEDAELDRLLADAERVAGERLVFVDAVVSPRIRSRLLWRYDRGRHPRTVDRLVEAVGAAFDVAEVERFRIHHEYALITGHPRARGTSSP
jgi:SAM-dependent methyltransferase/uncharacterized protein YbaR (Trm112 family)